MSKYLVTGGAGFIGTNLVKKLLADGHQVLVLDNYVGGRKEDRIQSGAEYIEGDIRNVADLDKVCVGIDGIFHMAALPRVSFSVENPELTHDVNVNGTLQVLMAAKRNKIKRVIFSSSSSTYGGQDAEKLLEEDTVIKKPVSPYALHKLIGEHYCRIFADLYGVETVSLIYFNVYGSYFDPEGAYALVVGKFLKQKKERKPMTICGDGEYFRDYTNVVDVVGANILAMQSEKVGKGETINIGCGRPTTVNQLVKMLGGDFVYIPERLGDQRFSGANNTKARLLLGWCPTVTLEDGIAVLKKEWDIE